MKIERKPTRRELLMILSKVQDLTGAAHGLHANDKNRMGFEYGQSKIMEAFELCVQASQFDSPIKKHKDILR